MSKPRSNRASVHGWLVLDKPVDLTSTQAVGKCKWLFNAKKAGHAGTLDPLATGILPIAFGEATKTVPFVMDGEKTYRFTVTWGAATTTDDSEGETIATSDARPSRAEIEAVLPRFTGSISQVPPRFSAIKVNGERAYAMARDGEDFELDARTVEIDELLLVEQPDANTATFESVCGKGTYVRSLARDMAHALGTEGHVTALRRTQVGPFDEADAISLESLDKIRHSTGEPLHAASHLLPVETALDDIPALAMNGEAAARLRRGQAVLAAGKDAPIEGPCFATERGVLVAIGAIDRGSFVPSRVFNLPSRRTG
ncbi:MAG: tRNA pseudouridine(55) synthase TruB [Pseudomonadota bacterium]